MLQNLSALGVEARWNRYSFLFDELECLHNVFTLVEVGARQHFVEDDADGPHVTFFRVGVASVGLGRHVSRRPNVIKHLRFFVNLLHRAVPEIDYLRCQLLIGVGNGQE